MIEKFRRIYAVPDIHGRLDLLDRGLECLDDDGYDAKQDLLIFLGDMIDRGPDSKGVLDLVIKLRGDSPDTVAVLRGNHESFAVNYRVNTHGRDIWYSNGGFQTEASYPNMAMSEAHVRFLADLPFHLEVQGFYFSHAPIPRDKHRVGGKGYSWSEPFGFAGEEYTRWEREWHYIPSECELKGEMMDKHEGPRSHNGVGSEFLIGVCGHIHRGAAKREIRVYPKYRMLDCGAGCFPNSPLAIHECLSGRTMYAYVPDQLRVFASKGETVTMES